MQSGRRTLLRLILSTAAAFFLIVAPAAAHAVLLESNPSLKGVVPGPNVPIKLRFNVRIDAARSRLTLVGPGGSMQPLEISTPAPPDTLSAQATGLAAGEYRLRWQVLASDGHITRGEIPFTVTRS
jgi:methionine-rich copper-binding protein CopC